MLFDNVRLYMPDGTPVHVKYVCAGCGHETATPFYIVYNSSTFEETYYCHKCKDVYEVIRGRKK